MNAAWGCPASARVRGLGFVNTIYCPHLDSEKRTDFFKTMVQRSGVLIGIGCEDLSVLEIVGGVYRVIGSGKQTRIEKQDHYRPLEELQYS
jgi:hypothetical protein